MSKEASKEGPIPRTHFFIQLKIAAAPTAAAWLSSSQSQLLCLDWESMLGLMETSRDSPLLMTLMEKDVE